MLLGVCGWKLQGEIPNRGKYVLVGAPHTSNWDFPLAIAASYVYRFEIRWLGKDTLFPWPFGWLIRWFGGIPVDRSHPHGMVGQLKTRFDTADNLIFAIAAKGTRKKTQYWKSGFYWLAYSARVPVIFCYLNYNERTICLGTPISLSGDVRKDMKIVRSFYTNMCGRHPELEDTIQLKEELEDDL